MRETVKIKDNLHALIEQTDNSELLEIFYQLLNSERSKEEGELVRKLTPKQRKELFEAYDESLDAANLIDLEKLKTKHSKWFEK